MIPFGPAELAAVAPEIALAAAGALIVLLEAFAPRTRGWFATLALASIAGYVYYLNRAPIGVSFGGRLETSSLTWLVGIFALLLVRGRRSYFSS